MKLEAMEPKDTIYLSKEKSLMIKAVAIILMLIHHFFTFPDFYIEGISYDYLTVFAKYMCGPTKLCVSLFAFLTGWAYFYNKNKTLKYSLNKITRFLINYWIVCIPFLILAYSLGGYSGGLGTTLLELFGISKSVMIFCWYVYFYIISILILPYISQIFNEKLISGVIMGCILPIVVGTILVKIGEDNLFFTVVANLKNYFPCIVMGFLFAKHKLFEKVKEILEIIKLDNAIAYILIIFVVLIGRYFISSFDFIYAPMVIFSLINLTDHMTWGNKVISFLGKQSTNIWFLHCAFFGSLGMVLQPIAYFPKNPILVLMWVIILCSLISVLINKFLSIIYEKLKL